MNIESTSNPANLLSLYEKGVSLDLSNGLRLCLDWLSWTLTSEEISNVDSVISMMGYPSSDFYVMPTGRNGYRSQLRHRIYPIFILYDGNSNMGIHVDVSGSAISNLLKHFPAPSCRIKDTPFGTQGYETSDFNTTVLRELLVRINELGHITRLDLAIDDIGAEYYTLSELHDIFSSHMYVSRFRTWKEFVSYRHDYVSGHTIYFGSRTSSIMLRIYDKQMEQNEKLIPAGQIPIETPWIRWELELKSERARRAAEHIIEGKNIAELTIGVLSNYMRILEYDNVRKTRCISAQKWDKFIDGIGKLKLYCAKPPKTLENTKTWIIKQVAPSLAAVVQAENMLIKDGGFEFLSDLMCNGSYRLRKTQYDMIRSYMGASA